MALRLVGAILLGLLPTTVGLVLCLTVVGLPLGIPLLIVGSQPLRKVVKDHIARQVEGPLDQGPKPWEN